MVSSPMKMGVDPAPETSCVRNIPLKMASAQLYCSVKIIQSFATLVVY